MTSISSVNAGSTAATEVATKKSTLSNSTKNELEALGITATDGMTEAEAQEKIAQAQQEENAENGDEQQGNSSESEILADAKTLAAQVGIPVASDADVSEILDDIGAELETMLEDADGNPAVLSQLSSYLSQLTNLDDQYETLQSAQSSFYSAMNMVSTNNKITLGLE